jgi:hypothetical protein
MATPPRDDAPPPPPPDFPEDILREILTRLPPDEPVSLLYAAAVCRPWLAIFCDPVFRQKYREFHRLPPVMGFVIGERGSERDFTTFLPVPPVRPRILELEDVDAVDARHSRVLLHSDTQGFSVWDPVRDLLWDVPIPIYDGPFDSWTATLLCGDTECNHLQCHGNRFIVAFVHGDTRSGVTTACSYSLATDIWSDVVSIDTGVLLDIKPSALVADSLFFRTRSSKGRIVRYNFRETSLSMVQPPNFLTVTPLDIALSPEEGGRGLLLAVIQVSTQTTLELWVTEVQHLRGWVHRASISISNHLPSMGSSPHVVGFAEGHGRVYFRDGFTWFSIRIKSEDISEVFTDEDIDKVIPYMSFAAIG